MVLRVLMFRVVVSRLGPFLILVNSCLRSYEPTTRIVRSMLTVNMRKGARTPTGLTLKFTSCSVLST